MALDPGGSLNNVMPQLVAQQKQLMNLSNQVQAKKLEGVHELAHNLFEINTEDLFVGGQANECDCQNAQDLSNWKQAQHEHVHATASPSKSTSEASEGGYKEVTVKPGQSISSILRDNGFPRAEYSDSQLHDEITQLNGLEDKNQLFPGQKLRIPSRGAGSVQGETAGTSGTTGLNKKPKAPGAKGPRKTGGKTTTRPRSSRQKSGATYQKLLYTERGPKPLPPQITA